VHKGNIIVLGDRNVIKKEAEKILKYKDLTVEVQCMWNVKTNVMPVITGNWNHLRIVHKLPEQHTRRVQNQGATGNSHIGHSTHTSESINVKVQTIQHRK
jgi:hypothetical protein